MSKIEPGSAEAFAKVGALEICYQTFGDKSDPPLLLIAGLGAQMILLEDDFCAALAARGFWVVRFDNRDIGKSTQIDWTAGRRRQGFAAGKGGSPRPICSRTWRATRSA